MARQIRTDVNPRVADLVVVVPGRHAVVSGRLDVGGVAVVRDRMYQLLDAGDDDRDLLLDLSGAVVADASGLALLVGLHQRARRNNRRLVLLDVPPELNSVIRRTRLRRVLATTTSHAC